MSPPALKIVKTWRDLKEAVSELRAFYIKALDAAEDLVLAADLCDEELLSAVLDTHKALKAPEAFRVSSELFGSVDSSDKVQTESEIKYVH